MVMATLVLTVAVGVALVLVAAAGGQHTLSGSAPPSGPCRAGPLALVSGDRRSR
jgi:hypothetical protein